MAAGAFLDKYTLTPVAHDPFPADIGNAMGGAAPNPIASYMINNPQYEEWQTQRIPFALNDQSNAASPPVPNNLPMQQPSNAALMEGSNRGYDGLMRNLFNEYQKRLMLLQTPQKPSDSI